jgi:hypothetical protein
LKHWVESRLTDANVTSVLNPCAGTATLDTDADVVRVDIDDSADADLHIDFRDLREYVSPQSFDAIIYDPPYTAHQATTKYGLSLSPDEFYFYDSAVFDLFDTLLEPGGMFIMFGYTTSGMPPAYGYSISDIAVFNKLGAQNDYLGTIFQKPPTGVDNPSSPPAYRAHTVTTPNAATPDTDSSTISTSGNNSQPLRVEYHRRHPETTYQTAITDAVTPWITETDRVLHIYQTNPSVALSPEETVISCRYTAPNIDDPPACPAVGEGQRQQASPADKSPFVAPTPDTNTLPAVFDSVDTDINNLSTEIPHSITHLDSTGNMPLSGATGNSRSSSLSASCPPDTDTRSEPADYIETPWNLSATFATGVFDAVILDLPYTAFQQTIRTPHEQATPGSDRTHVATALKRGISDIVTGSTGRVIQVGRTATLMSGLEFDYTRAGVTVVHHPQYDADRIVSVDVKSHSNLETAGLPAGGVDRYSTQHLTEATTHPHGATSKHHRTDLSPTASSHLCLHCGNHFYYHPALYRSCTTCGARPGSYCQDAETGRINHTTIHDTRVTDTIELHHHRCHTRDRTELPPAATEPTQTQSEPTATSLTDFK